MHAHNMNSFVRLLKTSFPHQFRLICLCFCVVAYMLDCLSVPKLHEIEPSFYITANCQHSNVELLSVVTITAPCHYSSVIAERHFGIYI